MRSRNRQPAAAVGRGRALERGLDAYRKRDFIRAFDELSAADRAAPLPAGISSASG